MIHLRRSSIRTFSLLIVAGVLAAACGSAGEPTAATTSISPSTSARIETTVAPSTSSSPEDSNDGLVELVPTTMAPDKPADDEEPRLTSSPVPNEAQALRVVSDPSGSGYWLFTFGVNANSAPVLYRSGDAREWIEVETDLTDKNQLGSVPDYGRFRSEAEGFFLTRTLYEGTDQVTSPDGVTWSPTSNSFFDKEESDFANLDLLYGNNAIISRSEIGTTREGITDNLARAIVTNETALADIGTVCQMLPLSGDGVKVRLVNCADDFIDITTDDVVEGIDPVELSDCLNSILSTTVVFRRHMLTNLQTRIESPFAAPGRERFAVEVLDTGELAVLVSDADLPLEGDQCDQFFDEPDPQPIELRIFDDSHVLRDRFTIPDTAPANAGRSLDLEQRSPTTFDAIVGTTVWQLDTAAGVWSERFELPIELITDESEVNLRDGRIIAVGDELLGVGSIDTGEWTFYESVVEVFDTDRLASQVIGITDNAVFFADDTSIVRVDLTGE